MPRDSPAAAVCVCRDPDDLPARSASQRNQVRQEAQIRLFRKQKTGRSNVGGDPLKSGHTARATLNNMEFSNGVGRSSRLHIQKTNASPSGQIHCVEANRSRPATPQCQEGSPRPGPANPSSACLKPATRIVSPGSGLAGQAPFDHQPAHAPEQADTSAAAATRRPAPIRRSVGSRATSARGLHPSDPRD